MSLSAKTCIWGLQVRLQPVCSATETSYITETVHVASLVVKLSRVNNNGANQTAQMRIAHMHSLVRAFVFLDPDKKT